MARYARDENGTLRYPTQDEFRGIPNYMQHDRQLRKRNYLPIANEAEQRNGYTAEPASWHVEDGSIVIDEWNYIEIEQPAPRDTTVRDTAEKAIVGRIMQLVEKYGAQQEFALLLEGDITIPSLLVLADAFEVDESDIQSVKSDIAILVLDLMAKEGGTWQACWDGLKSRFPRWVAEIRQNP